MHGPLLMIRSCIIYMYTQHRWDAVSYIVHMSPPTCTILYVNKDNTLSAFCVCVNNVGIVQPHSQAKPGNEARYCSAEVINGPCTFIPFSYSYSTGARDLWR